MLEEDSDVPVAGGNNKSKNFHNHMSSIQNFEHEKESSSQHQHISIQNQNVRQMGAANASKRRGRSRRQPDDEVSEEESQRL